MAGNTKNRLEAYDRPQSLMTKTKELMDAHSLTIVELHVASNISYYWLMKFSAGKFKNPSVNRVQYLYEFLTGTQLLQE